MNKSEARLHSLGSSCHLLIHDPGDSQEILTAAREEFHRLEQKFSPFAPDSVISAINQNAGTGIYTPLDDESLSLFRYASALWRESSHLFDPTTRLLEDCYDSDGKLLASEAQLKNMLQLVGWSRLEVTDKGARLAHKGMLIDLNSCIRPYAVDSVRKLLQKAGVNSALIELDQDVATLGKQADGANWLVGMRHPSKGKAAITRLKLNSKGFAIRGDFERRIWFQGEHFGRGLSPVDGQPVPGLLSVAVIADNCLTACSAASIARLKTEPAALKWLDSLDLPWLAIDRELNCHGPLSPGR